MKTLSDYIPLDEYVQPAKSGIVIPAGYNIRLVGIYSSIPAVTKAIQTTRDASNYENTVISGKHPSEQDKWVVLEVIPDQKEATT